MKNVNASITCTVEWSSEDESIAVVLQKRKFIGSFVSKPKVRALGPLDLTLNTRPSYEVNDVFECKKLNLSVGYHRQGEFEIRFLSQDGAAVASIVGTASEEIKDVVDAVGQWTPLIS